MKKKILFVEQTTLYEKMLRTFLSKDNFEFATVKDVDVALVKVVRWQPDFIITGIEIGNITGFDFCLLLKMMPDFAGIPLIPISSYDNKIAQLKAADAGADYYVVKDHDLVDKIKAILEEILSPRDAEEKQTKQREIKKVLVVDDPLTMRKIIKNILHGIGIAEVIEANNGKEGLQKLTDDKCGMVISDWAMPVMNGLEMVKNIRANPDNDDLPVVHGLGRDRRRP